MFVIEHNFDALREKEATILRTYVLYKCFISFWMQMQDAESEFCLIKTTWSPKSTSIVSINHTQRRVTAVQYSTGYTYSYYCFIHLSF
jgi:hypothetical protein